MTIRSFYSSHTPSALQILYHLFLLGPSTVEELLCSIRVYDECTIRKNAHALYEEGYLSHLSVQEPGTKRKRKKYTLNIKAYTLLREQIEMFVELSEETGREERSI